MADDPSWRPRVTAIGSTPGAVGTEAVSAAGRWWPVGFVSRGGDVVQEWACRLPADFTDRLVEDLDGLRREVAEQAAAARGRLIMADRVMVDGRSAFRRIVRLPADSLPVAVYVAGLVVPLGGEMGVEITVTCHALGDLLDGPVLAHAGG